MFGGRRFGVAAALAMVFAGGGVGLAAASSRGIHKPTTIRVLLKHPAFQIVDNNGKKNIGDELAFNEQMWNATGRQRIGHLDAACTVTRANDSRFLCNIVFTFTGRGEISTTGLSPESGAADTDPVVGGDGEFKNASGQADFGNFNKPTVRVTLELEP